MACPILVLIIYLKRKKTFLEQNKKTDKTAHVRVWKKDHEELMERKRDVGYKNLASAVHSLLVKNESDLPSVEKVMEEHVPVVLTGLPLSGKTYFVRNKLIPQLNPVLVIDRLGDYEDLEDLGHKIYGFDFKRSNGKVRFVPNKRSELGKTEVESIFRRLMMIRDELANWTIIAEEAHVYHDLGAFTDFLYGSRHYVRKMIVVTPKTDAFPGLLTFMASRSYKK